VVLRTVAGRRAGESADDLRNWLSQLPDCPPITQTVLTTCHNPRHIDEPATWFYVEADARLAVARRRCLSCGGSFDVLDSGEHWNAPRMWGCPTCGQSIAEVAAGLHVEDDAVTWVALAARCVDCGTIDGLTDFNVGPASVDDVIGRV
jgi:uncharacterized protein with PIN domain